MLQSLRSSCPASDKVAEGRPKELLEASGQAEVTACPEDATRRSVPKGAFSGFKAPSTMVEPIIKMAMLKITSDTAKSRANGYTL